MEIFSAANLGSRLRVSPRGRSRTKQSFRDESNIDIILARYVKTGNIDHLAKHGAQYGFADSISFHEAMNVVTKADQMFLDLPAEIRRRFEGDPGVFLDFVQNPENQEEMIKLGLATRKEGVAPVVEEPVLPAESAPITPEVVPDTVVASPGGEGS